MKTTPDGMILGYPPSEPGTIIAWNYSTSRGGHEWSVVDPAGIVKMRGFLADQAR